MDTLLLTVIAVVALALLFDFSNGFHDAANSIATVVATKALSPMQAVLFSAVCNFLAYFFVGTAVANTVAKTVKSGFVSVPVIFAALLAAIVWNYLTWFVGMPSSSSHAIIGGLVGAGLAVGGTAAVSWKSVTKVLYAIVLSPLVAFSVVALSLMVLRRRNPELERPFKVPFYPVVPILTIVVCVYVLTSLRPITWVICVSWLALVFVFYLLYGRRHATLSHYVSEEEISEPIHPEDER